MNHDGLDGLLRRLVAPRGDDRGGRPPIDRERTPAGIVRTDGGEASDEDDAHLRDLPDGAGCTEIWEHLSERQAESRPEDGRAGESQADD